MGLVADWCGQLRSGPTLHLDYQRRSHRHSRERGGELYRIAQELLTNALRHGRPSRIFLRLGRSEAGPRTVTLTLDDDGGGRYTRAASHTGRGLVGIRARLAAWAEAFRSPAPVPASCLCIRADGGLRSPHGHDHPARR